MIFNNLTERVRRETDAICVKEFVLEFDPMKTQGVQEALQHIHHEQDTERNTSKDTVANKGSEPVHVQCC